MQAHEVTLKPQSGLTTTLPSENKLTLAKVRSAYQWMAPLYDGLFGACFRPGQRATVTALASQPNEKILEVGVGTGLALPLWHRESIVTGIDVTENMLQRAHQVCRKHHLTHVKLQLMDAQATSYPDNYFDKIAAMYVVSVVPNVPALLAEMRRICKPGGRIAIVNHFAHRNALINQMERLLAHHAPLLGFNTALPLENVTHAPGLNILKTQKVNFGGYWTMIMAENSK